uniref:CSON014288 protein n=1 Tax=Culicoides sonorensis TaxID=179676 RepID=A0A336MFW0_CULSO
MIIYFIFLIFSVSSPPIIINSNPHLDFSQLNHSLLLHTAKSSCQTSSSSSLSSQLKQNQFQPVISNYLPLTSTTTSLSPKRQILASASHQRPPVIEYTVGHLQVFNQQPRPISFTQSPRTPSKTPILSQSNNIVAESKRHTIGCFGNSSPINALFNIICKENGIHCGGSANQEIVSSLASLEETNMNNVSGAKKKTAQKRQENGTSDKTPKIRPKTPQMVSNKKNESPNDSMRLTRSKAALLRQTNLTPSSSSNITTTTVTNVSISPTSLLPDSRRSKSVASSPVNSTNTPIRTTRTSRLRAASLAKSPTTDIQPIQRSPSVNEQEKQIKQKITTTTTTGNNNITTAATGVSPTNNSNNAGAAICSANNNVNNNETQPRRKLSIPTISSMQINQTLSDCEVTVGKRSTSVSGVSNRTRTATVKKVPQSPTNGQLSDSPNKSSQISKTDKDKSSKRKSNLNRNDENVLDESIAARNRHPKVTGVSLKKPPSPSTPINLTSPRKNLAKSPSSGSSSSPSPIIAPAGKLKIPRQKKSDMERLSPRKVSQPPVTGIVHKSRKDSVSPGVDASSVKSSYQSDTKLSVDDSKFNKMLKSPTLEAHPRLEKRTRLMGGSRSLDRGPVTPESNTGVIPKVSPRQYIIDVPVVETNNNINHSNSNSKVKQINTNPQVLEILKYSNDDPQLNKGSIICIENDDDELSSSRMMQDINSKQQQRAAFGQEQHISFDKAVESAAKSQHSPTVRRKSDSEHQTGAISNHIVSILKKKDVESSSAPSSNASPVTFSPSVVDTPVRNTTKQGILKKRSSLDESRYSRSHSPDDRSILVKHNRRNSLEETHGILKQPSVESKEDSCHGSHGILKKKESITPSGEPKHVSISQAVILAAAEICKDIVNTGLDEAPYEIKPILKQDSQIHTPSNGPAHPKPILKKKFCSEGEELSRNYYDDATQIRPILKSSRKSSRDEANSDTDNESVGSSGKRSILKTDSPSKRRSFGDPFETNIIMQRSKSLENPEPKHLEVHTSPERVELPLISVQERIKSMEQFLVSKPMPASTTATNSNVRVVPKSAPVHRRDFKERFKTHPITVDELSSAASKREREIFKPSSLDTLNKVVYHQDTGISSLTNTITSSHSSDFNTLVASVSSDSGIQFGKLSEMSNSGENIYLKSSDDSEKPQKQEEPEMDVKSEKFIDVDDDVTDKIEIIEKENVDKCEENVKLNEKSDDVEMENDTETKEVLSSSLKRTNSVKARANLFQELEKKQKENEKPVLQKPKRVPSVRLRAELEMEQTGPEQNTNKSNASVSDDSGTEFEPSNKKFVEKFKFFAALTSTSSSPSLTNSGNNSPTTTHKSMITIGAPPKKPVAKSLSDFSTYNNNNNHASSHLTTNNNNHNNNNNNYENYKEQHQRANNVTTVLITNDNTEVINHYLMQQSGCYDSLPPNISSNNLHNNKNHNNNNHNESNSEPNIDKKISENDEKECQKSAEMHQSLTILPSQMTPNSNSNKPKRLMRKIGKLMLPKMFLSENNNNEVGNKKFKDPIIEDLMKKSNNEKSSKVGRIKSLFMSSSLNMEQRKIEELPDTQNDSGKENESGNENSGVSELTRQWSIRSETKIHTPPMQRRISHYFNGPSNESKITVTNDTETHKKNIKNKEKLSISINQTQFDISSISNNNTNDLHTPLNSPFIDSDFSCSVITINDDTNYNSTGSPLNQDKSNISQYFSMKQEKTKRHLKQSTPLIRTVKRRIASNSFQRFNQKRSQIQFPVKNFEDIYIEHRELKEADKAFKKIYFDYDSSKTTLSPPSTNTSGLTVSDIKKGILKSKSGAIGLFPTDLSSELKNRLKKSTHASVSNLKKSATTVIPRNNTSKVESDSKDNSFDKDKSHDSAIRDTSGSESSESEEDEKDIEPGKNLAKILRSVSKASTGPDDGGKLLKNLVSVGKSAQHARTGHGDQKTDMGKDLLSAIANSAVARRKNLKER